MAKVRLQTRFGIAEWYGRPFHKLNSQERKRFVDLQTDSSIPRPQCPFLSSADRDVPCWKQGGVCSIRQYERLGPEGEVKISPTKGTIRATCPSRFEQEKLIYAWIAEIVLRNPAAVPIGQVNFLERVPLIGQSDDEVSSREVGRIDNVMIVPGSAPLEWCPVEIQSVYFSGDKMEHDFGVIARYTGTGIPFPGGARRPDYRSSGPKRLMPQLQIKVPTLRRWGKKMAVVVDEDFYKAMGRMQTVSDLSNGDVAWFIMRYDESGDTPRLARGEVHFTTLEGSVESLIAGKPVPQPVFEQRIMTKLQNLGAYPVETPTDE